MLKSVKSDRLLVLKCPQNRGNSNSNYPVLLLDRICGAASRCRDHLNAWMVVRRKPQPEDIPSLTAQAGCPENLGQFTGIFEQALAAAYKSGNPFIRTVQILSSISQNKYIFCSKPAKDINLSDIDLVVIEALAAT